MSTASQPSDEKSTREKVMEMREAAAQNKPNNRSSGSQQTDEEAEANSLQAQIENSLSDSKCRLPVGDARVQFRTFNGDCSDCPDHPDDHTVKTGGDLSDLIALTDERLDRMNTDNYAERYHDEVFWLCEVLDWSSEPEFMEASWWREMFSIKRRREYLNLIQSERDLTREEIKKLRKAGRV